MDETTTRSQPPVFLLYRFYHCHPTACPVLAAPFLEKKEDDSKLHSHTICGRNRQVSHDGSQQRLNTDVASSPRPPLTHCSGLCLEPHTSGLALGLNAAAAMVLMASCWEHGRAHARVGDLNAKASANCVLCSLLYLTEKGVVPLQLNLYCWLTRFYWSCGWIYKNLCWLKV